MRAVVVGGGIGGLAAAVALHRRGWGVEVLERAPSFGEIGAGLSLWPNALRALDALGVLALVRAGSVAQGVGGIRDRRGRWLARADAEVVRRHYGDTVMIHRARLLDILRDALPESSLRTGISVVGAATDGTVLHSAGSSGGDLVVGADGLRSAVRTAFWPASQPRYAGYTAWRVVTPRAHPIGLGFESWGRGLRFGAVPLSDGRIYCFAVANAPEGHEDQGLAGLRARFADWHDPVPALLASARPEDLLHHDIYDLRPPPSYVAGRVALVGDAAHAMTPNLGQGACQALEDAVALGAWADRGSLPGYDAQRRPHATMVTRRSARVGRLAQLSWSPAVAVRDAAVRLTPQSVFLRSLRPILA